MRTFSGEPDKGIGEYLPDDEENPEMWLWMEFHDDGEDYVDDPNLPVPDSAIRMPKRAPYKGWRR